VYFIEKTAFQFGDFELKGFHPLPMKKSLSVYGVLWSASAGCPASARWNVLRGLF
jgi:hypothetical protein